MKKLTTKKVQNGSLLLMKDKDPKVPYMWDEWAVRQKGTCSIKFKKEKITISTLGKWEYSWNQNSQNPIFWQVR